MYVLIYRKDKIKLWLLPNKKPLYFNDYKGFEGFVFEKTQISSD